jgi:hypothetical protein
VSLTDTYKAGQRRSNPEREAGVQAMVAVFRSVPDSGQSTGASQQAGKKWADEYKEKIELFYLPGYSPELNPEERLNADLKHAIRSKVPVRTKAKLKEAAIKHILILEQSPDRVKKYFQDPYVKYAA